MFVVDVMGVMIGVKCKVIEVLKFCLLFVWVYRFEFIMIIASYYAFVIERVKVDVLMFFIIDVLK